MPDPLPNPLLDHHRRSSEAELQAYGPIEIAATFGSPQAEYAAIRRSCALMDLPHRGLLELRGRDRLSLLNNLVSNETWAKGRTVLAAGSGVYAFFLNLRGRIVADMNILERGDHTLVETDVRMVPVLCDAWQRYVFTEQVTIQSRIGALHQLALHGPGATEVLRQCDVGHTSEAGPLESRDVQVLGVPAVLWRDDVCGSTGLHVVLSVADAPKLWDELNARFATSQQPGRRALRPIGWAAFNTARIEAGRPLLDIDFPAAAPDRPGARLRPGEAEQEPDDRSVAGALPAETGQEGRALCYTKCYIGQEVVARMHARKQLARRIVGIRMAGDELPIAGAEVLDAAGAQIGMVTSSTPSPALSGAAICLAMLKKPHFQTGTTVQIPAEGAVRSATVVDLPFAQFGAKAASE